MKKDDIKLDEGYETFSEGPKFEFPREIFSLTKESEDLLKDNKDNKAKSTDFESLLLELNKQVSDADTSVAALVSQKEELNNRKLQIEEDEKKLSNERFSFEQEMKNEKQKSSIFTDTATFMVGQKGFDEPRRENRPLDAFLILLFESLNNIRIKTKKTASLQILLHLWWAKRDSNPRPYA